jgi:hypothetical protein
MEDNGQLIIVPKAPADVVAITWRRVNFFAFMVISLLEMPYNDTNENPLVKR